MKLFKIGSFITQRLGGICGNKIYPLIAPVNTTYPFVVYRRIGGQATNRDKDVEDESVTLEIQVIDSSYKGSIDKIDQISDALMNHVSSDVMRITMNSSSEQAFDDAFIQTIIIQIDLA